MDGESRRSGYCPCGHKLTIVKRVTCRAGHVHTPPRTLVYCWCDACKARSEPLTVRQP
jgi:hypothetical protein